MKNFYTLLVLLISCASLFASTLVEPPHKPLMASEFRVPVGPDKVWLSLEEIANMKPREFAAATHQHLNFFERGAFALGQRKLRRSINADGTIDNARLTAMIAPEIDGETGFHIGGFALGFFLGLIGVLIAYLINDDKKSNRRKWAWLGLGTLVALTLILTLLFG